MESPHWQRFGLGHHHGIALPLSALRSRQSCGIGEYLDLLPLIDWCAEVGFGLIQLLPLTDSGNDPSPYNGLSALALHPIYLTLEGPGLERLRRHNCAKRVPYHKVLHEKLAWLREWAGHFVPDSDFHAFVERNPWLHDYAAFKPDDPPLFHQIIQYLCDQQMRQVRVHADTRGVKLMGDIPLLLSPGSADVAAHPDLFDTSVAVGCPPDLYSRRGQYWGFPAYRWEEHRRTGFGWWRQRLQQAERYFHCYRIDHVVGFFHLWLIPPGKHPRQGAYHPCHFDEWMEQGTELMEMMLGATQILPIGEDLGVVPTAVRRALHRLEICTTMFLPWERRLGSYKPGEEYPEMSLTTIGTHDALPLSTWWRSSPAMARDLADLLGVPWQRDFSHRTELLRYSHRTRSRLHVNPLQEYLALRPEWASSDRINIPGKRSRRNWTYRFHPTLEELAQCEDLKQQIRDIIPKG